MNRSIDGCFITHNGMKHFLKEYSNFHAPVFSADISSIFLQYIIKQIVKGNFFFRRYYVACQITNICKHFTAPEHFSVHRDSKMFAKIGDLTSSIISSEKNLPLLLSIFVSYVNF